MQVTQEESDHSGGEISQVERQISQVEGRNRRGEIAGRAAAFAGGDEISQVEGIYRRWRGEITGGGDTLKVDGRKSNCTG